MKIVEIDADAGADPNQLLGLVNFLAGRAANSNAQKQISQAAFIELAQSLGINMTKQNIAQIVGSLPLSGVLEPLDAKSGMVTFRGADIGLASLSVPQAQQVVAKSAKSAMNRMK